MTIKQRLDDLKQKASDWELKTWEAHPLTGSWLELALFALFLVAFIASAHYSYKTYEPICERVCGEGAVLTYSAEECGCAVKCSVMSGVQGKKVCMTENKWLVDDKGG